MVVYLSFDVEADNKTPTVGSMIQLGIYTDGAEFCVNIIPQEGEGITQNADTIAWLKEQGVYEGTKVDAVTPQVAMARLAAWLRDVVRNLEGPGGTTQFRWIAKPAAFDWMWLASYWHRYGPADKCDIGFKAACIASMRDAFFEVYFSLHPDKDPKTATQIEHRMMDGPLLHDALDDARNQYQLFTRIMFLLPRIASKDPVAVREMESIAF
jgi:hypothetical protein